MHASSWVTQRVAVLLSHASWVAFPLLLVCAVLGLIAVLFPDRFRRIATSGSTWVDTNRFFQRLDTPVNIDRPVLQHARVFGVLVVAAALFLGYLLFQRFGF